MIPRIPRIASLLGAVILFASQAHAQTPATPVAHGPHTVVIKLVQRDGAMPFAFDPAIVHVQEGDTVEFENAADVMHNVRFVHTAPGAKLGAAAVAPYLTKVGDEWKIVIDGRFTDGTYAFVCDPHAMIGMKGTLVVSGGPAVAGAK